MHRYFNPREKPATSSCYNNLPAVPCDEVFDCYDYIKKTCSPGDLEYLDSAVCSSSFCCFYAKGNSPINCPSDGLEDSG